MTKLSREGLEIIFEFAFTGNKPAKARPVCVFPPPDSPISAVIFPGGIVKDIWSTTVRLFLSPL